MNIEKQFIFWKKDDFFSELSNDCSNDEEIERTKENIELINIINGEELFKLYLKSHVVFLPDFFENII